MKLSRIFHRIQQRKWLMAVTALAGTIVMLLYFFQGRHPLLVDNSSMVKVTQDYVHRLRNPHFSFDNFHKHWLVNEPAESSFSESHIANYNLNDLHSTSKPIQNQEKVLILTPMVKFNMQYWLNLVSLAYPKQLIELGFILPRNEAGDAAMQYLKDEVSKIQSKGKEERFAKVTILRQSLDKSFQASRNNFSHQKQRRSVLASIRNELLFSTVTPSISWVLWLDSDIIDTPRTLIQDLASHDKPVVAANVHQRIFNQAQMMYSSGPYDFNSWVESKEGLELASKMQTDDIIVEGYPEMVTKRQLMGHLYDAHGDIAKEMVLDGVGASCTLVKAEVHRDGAMFPSFPFYHLIESEGFAKMAKRLGYEVIGLPNYRVMHMEE